MSVVDLTIDTDATRTRAKRCSDSLGSYHVLEVIDENR
jgi:hypothetical protein